jgi:F0F1-type ATP synthase delta subunit
MSANPLASRIASPYARALSDFSVEKNIMHQITADFQNLEISELTNLNNLLLIKMQNVKFYQDIRITGK